jgi:hypothetical protein
VASSKRFPRQKEKVGEKGNHELESWTHDGTAGLEKEVHRSTDRVHLEKAGISLSQVAATGCLAQLSEVTICVLLAQKAAFAKAGAGQL